jgi:SAM-dependent methyltransferase
VTTTATSETQVRDTPAWTADAIDYDAWFDTPWGRYAFAVEAATVLRATGDLAGRRVLDAGCGTGRFSAALADRHRAVTGIDPDPSMLHLARARATTGCARAAVEYLPFPDDSFDVTLAVTVFEFVADPAAAAAELARVTGDSGRIIIAALNPRSPWGLANRRRLRSAAWCQARFLTRRDLRQLAAPHGTAMFHGSLYAPSLFPGLSVIGPVLESLGGLAPTFGAFQVLVVDKDSR